jgi:hypothetical protein
MRIFRPARRHWRLGGAAVAAIVTVAIGMPAVAAPEKAVGHPAGGAVVIADQYPGVETRGQGPRGVNATLTPVPADDFRISVSPASGSLRRGGSVTVTVNTTSLGPFAQYVELSVRNLPSGVTATFSPQALWAGESATLRITAASNAASGIYNLTVVGTGWLATRTASYALTVPSQGAYYGCWETNNTDVPISDHTTVESPVVIIGCSGNASSVSRVSVNIVHTWIGDLVVSLVAPNGAAYKLHDRTGGGADNIVQTYTVNLSGHARNGTWKLRVQDVSSGDVGYINSWSLELAPLVIDPLDLGVI